MEDAEGPCLEIAPDADGRAANLQQDLPIAGRGFQSLLLRLRWRIDGTTPGDASWKRAVVQARYLKGGKEFGNWISLGGGNGTTAWAERETESRVPADADAIRLQVAHFGTAGRLLVSSFEVEGLDAAARTAWVYRFRPAEPYGDPVPEAVLHALSRGTSINNWFDQPYNARMDGKKGTFDAEWFDRFVTDAELKALADAGFRCIRHPMEPEPFFDSDTGALRRADELERAIRRIQAAGLAVVFNPHPKQRLFRPLSKDPALQEKFLLWTSEVAAFLARFDAAKTVYEPLNEPACGGFYKGAWCTYQDRLVAAIRRVNPDITLVLNAGGYQLWTELLDEPAHPDRNTIWAVHYYQPGPFTHQGSPWMRDWYKPLRDVPWPFGWDDYRHIVDSLDRTGANAEYAEQTPGVIRSYIGRGEGREGQISDDFDQLLGWWKRNDRVVWIGEFGVDRTHAPAESRARWIQAVVEACERHGFGWSTWEYQSSMGFASGEPGARVLDPAMLKAFRLGPPPLPVTATPNLSTKPVEHPVPPPEGFVP